MIHIENQWAENEKTVDGKFLHRNAHNPVKREKRGDVLTVAGLYIHSYRLGISGQCDIVEFHADPNGIELHGENGRWIPYPVEYKRGREKGNSCDEAQLCAQGICLEEMYCCHLDKGALYYGEVRRREEVLFSENLRQMVTNQLMEMHKLYQQGRTPAVHMQNGCRSCSLIDICIPKLEKQESVSAYIQRMKRTDI